MHEPDRPGNVDGPTRTADVPHDAGTISTRPAYGPEGTLRHDPDKPTQSHPLGPTGAFSAPPGYEILGELGRGAMGVVYSARQVALNRTVALKMVLAGEHAEPRELVRFLAEAEAVAAIDHRNVVRVHEFGQYNSRPFLSMEAVPGGTLADRIRAKGGSGPIPPAEAAALIEQVARGVHAAHEVGIVHRDLKPGNILLSADGTPKVADFGLAKRQTGSDLTNTGAILGTPAYMAPEQARGQTKYVGPQADVHALGAVLFACLTGRPPFDEPDAVAVIMKVANQDAPSLRRVAAWVPKDLSIICAKCLAKDPKDRYSTAAALADDLRRFLDGKPILARRSGAIDQLWRWSRRNPGVATLFSAVAALLVVISVGATVAAVQYEAKRTAAESAEKRAVRAETDRRVQLHETELNQAREKRASAGVGQRLNSLRAIRSINDVRAGGERPAGELARLREEAVAALSTIDLKPLGPATPLPPYGIFEVDVSPDLRRYACEDAGSGGTVIRSFDGSSSPVRCPPPPGSGTILRRFSPDGSKLLLLHAQPVPGYDPKPDKLQVVSTATGKDVINKDWAGNGFTIRFLPAGDRLIANDADGSIVVLDFEGRVARSPSRYRVNQFAVHPDGRRVAVAEHDRPIQVLEIETWKPLDTIPLTNATALEWSPNGMWLAVGLPTGGVVVRNYLDKFQFTVPPRHLGPVIGLHFLADDRTLASWSADGESQLWQWAANRMLLRVPGRILGIEPLTDRLAVATDRDLQLFEPVDGGEYRVLGTAATAASPSPDGRFLVVSDGTAGVSLWDAVTSQWLTTLGLDLCGPVRFRPGGQEFATFGEYSRLNRWPYRYTDDGRLLVGPPAGMPFTRPRVRLGVGDEFIRTVTQIAIEEPRHLGRSVAWTAGGSRLLVCDFKDWRLALTEPSASIAREVVTDFKDPICVAASPDGGYYAAGRFRFSESGVWRAVDGRRVLTAPGCRSVAFSADGRYFATAGAETCQIYRVGQWDKPLVSVPLVVRLAEVDGPPLAFRDDGRALAVPFSPETVGLIDPETGSVLLTVPMPFTGAVADLAFSPDGGKLIVTLPYRNVHVWDLRRIGAALTELGLGLPTDLPASDGPQTTRVTGVTVNRGSLPPAVTGWTATLLKMAYYEYLLGKFSDAVEASTRAVNLLENHRQTTPLGEALFARSKYYLANGEPGPARDDLVAADRNLSDRPDVRLVLVRLVVLGPESVRDAGLALNLLTGLGAGEPALLRAAALVRLNAATEAASALDAIPEDNRGGVWYYLKTLHEARTGGPAVAKPWLDRATTAYEKAAKRTDDRMKLDELKRLKAEAESAVGR